MGLQDLIVTPIYLLLLYALAYWIRPRVTNRDTRKYFIPGLTAKFVGAIALGLIYQFYYGGGDTFTYFHLGSRWIWRAFLDNPVYAFQLIFSNFQDAPGILYYASRIYTYGDQASYFVVRVAGVFDILTFSTYSATSLLFTTFSFVGIWALFSTFCKFYSRLKDKIAWAILFLPSMFFWGSGLMKDSLTLGALGMLFFGVAHLLVLRQKPVVSVVFIIVGFFILYVVKIYILLCFLPAVAVWVFYTYQAHIRNTVVRILALPVLVSLGIMAAYFAVTRVSDESARYSLESIAYTAESTARWNYFVSERNQGSGYSLGDYDFSPAGVARKFPLAVVTSFFRPFLWEARNPVMLIAALENTVILVLTIMVLRTPSRWHLVVSDHLVLLCLIFAVFFGFAVGITTYNFGSLVRYRLPMLPFLLVALVVLNYGHRQKR